MATAVLERRTFAGGWVLTYTVSYPELDRTLAIHFEEAFPHAIVGWEESHVSGWGRGAKRLTTRATRKKSLLLDYWKHNAIDDAAWRAKLGLE